MRGAVSAWLGCVLGIAVVSAACGGDPGPADAATGDADIGFSPVGVETSAPESLTAGDRLIVTCLLLDEAGEAHSPPDGTMPAIRVVPEDSVQRTDEGIVATRAGTLEVACTFASLGLADQTPAFVEVVPGPPAWVTTELDFDSIAAGETTSATCAAADAWGNPVPADGATVRADPPDDRNTFDGTTGTFERAGDYEVLCEIEGARTVPARLEVLPGLPANLVISLVPDLPVYVIGQVVELARLVTDRFGNPTDLALVPVTSAPTAGTRQIGDGRFRFSRDGRYTLTATVTPPTDGGVRLTESIELIVDSQGPAIDCRSPVDGGLLDARPGAAIPFSGVVADTTGVTSVSVNGTNVPFDAAGAFVAPVVTRFGANFVDVVAVDTSGRETSRTCAFLVANRWAPDDASLADSVSLSLRQAVFDDGVRTDPLDSLNDVLHTVLNSSGLAAELHAALLAANPLKPSSCDQSVLGVCVLRSEVTYLDSQLNGPHDTTLTLVTGGMRADVVVRNLRMRIRVRGRVTGINYDTTGWVTFDTVTISTVFEPSIAGGQPRIAVRSGSTTATVGRVSTSFSGLDGAVINVVVSLFNGTVRNLVSGLLRDYVEDNLGDILDDLVRSLDVTSLGTTFDVARLDGSGDVSVTFTPRFSSVDTTSSRMLFGLGTQLRAMATHARPTLGAPVPPGGVLHDPSGSASTAISVNVGLLGQALHALWRGGFFDATVDARTVPGLPSGSSMRLTSMMPPAAEISGADRVQVSMGAMRMRLVYPDVLSGPLDAMVGVRASMRVRVVGDELQFDDFRLEDLYVSPFTISIDMATRTTVEGLLTRVMERVIGRALGDGLPALPIPTFELPSSLSTYGLPGGARMGLTSPAFSTSPNHLVLAGGFGVLP